MTHLEISTASSVGKQTSGTVGMAALGNKWGGGLRELSARIDVVSVFSGGIWFRLHRGCIYFSYNHIPEGKFQWFVGIISYLQFLTGGVVSTA